MDYGFKNVPYPLYLVNDIREPSSEVLDIRDKSFLPKVDTWFKNVPYPLYLVNNVREPSSEVLDINERSFLPSKWVLGLRMPPVLFTLSMT
jgi:hypothetical protein